MDDHARPITKYQQRVRNDMRAHSRYARRRDIDAYHEQRRLERQLMEPTDDQNARQASYF